MSELRQDPTTREWVIVAPERAKRLKQSPKKEIAVELPHWDSSCPFCPGNESLTPPEVFRLPLSSGVVDWKVRVVPNRFAALGPDGDVKRREEGYLFRKMDGVGMHEVIIETPAHDTTMALIPYYQVEKVLSDLSNQLFLPPLNVLQNFYVRQDIIVQTISKKIISLIHRLLRGTNLTKTLIGEIVQQKIIRFLLFLIILAHTKVP